MHGPTVSGWLLVTLCGGIGSYCLVRMRACAGSARGSAGSEALMGFGMAAMAVPAVVFTPPDWAWLLYTGVFGGAAIGSLRSVRRGVHQAHHLIGSLTMVYMAVSMAYPAGHVGHSTAGVPLLTGGLLAYYAVYVLRSGARLLPTAVPAGEAAPAVRWGEPPALAGACRLTMGLAMLAMLVTL
ncbi:DUF5134 domain-containing protein [Streptomyces albipurpureus]|uniref:DUF5134 domain-containing protein n=1 Tax=Streptomyces albipurpureus TaxID=2897419 RepID=A0ABT0UUT0_9ACTN|nr:DUF5134 domain-containing protein [Streptomyces sp. CWNU-1]MCM2392338.1 DUF5134 domain-containing protein [Streptomyces sp. CWNU-1]